MKLTIHTVDGTYLHVEDFDADTAFDLLDELRQGNDAWLTLEMDAGTVVVAKAHIVRVELD